VPSYGGGQLYARGAVHDEGKKKSIQQCSLVFAGSLEKILCKQCPLDIGLSNVSVQIHPILLNRISTDIHVQ
jgi:hypothetical protein